MRPEQFAPEHQRSLTERAAAADRRVAPSTLRALLRWATSAWSSEVPTLSHSLSLTDGDGTPLMSGQARSYIGIAKRGDEPDDWLRIASKCDDDGFYLYPMRRALLLIPKDRQAFARDLIANVLSPQDITRLHGVPDWCANDVVAFTLRLIWAKYADRPMPRTGPRSDSQLDADAAA